MQATFNQCIVELVQGDITRQKVDAIVNAANNRLAGGGGVDGAIHRAAGPSVMQETARLYPNGCPTGDAVVSNAGTLSATYIIHAVGPVWRGGKRGEPALLASAFERSLRLAVDNGCQSVAFPAISTGAYGYPFDEAAAASLGAIKGFLEASGSPPLVRVVLHDAFGYNAFAGALRSISGAP